MAKNKIMMLGKSLSDLEVFCSCPRFKRGSLVQRDCRCTVDGKVFGKKSRFLINIPVKRIVVAKKVL